MVNSREDIKKILKKHEIIHYMIKCIKNYNNRTFRKMILGKTESLIIENNGERVHDFVIYHIYYNNDKAGMFAILKEILNYIVFADKYQLYPVVELGKKINYYDEEFSKEMNPFNYYFMPYNGITIEDYQHSSRVVEAKPEDIIAFCRTQEGYKYEDRIQLYARNYKKYFNLEPHIKEAIQIDINKLWSGGDSVLGVHIRGTDYKNSYNRHPVYVLVEEYIAAIKEAMQDHTYKMIFVATDEQEALKKIKSTFGEEHILYFSDTTRSLNGAAIHLKNVSNVSQGKCYRYKLGYEVIRDVYALANCDGLIGGLSNVSLFARIIKCSKDNEYKYIRILDKGINKNYHEI